MTRFEAFKVAKSEALDETSICPICQAMGTMCPPHVNFIISRTNELARGEAKKDG